MKVEEPMKILLGAFFGMAIAGAASADWNCRHEAPVQVSASVAGVTKVQIDARAGSLKVAGVESAQIRAHGRACASSEGLLGDIRLETRRSGNVLIVEAVIPESSGRIFGDDQRRLDFTVEVPASLPVEINDGSGSIEVRGVAAVEIEDGSGEIEIASVAGSVSIDDGSGEIEIENVGGPVRITDGSGEIDVENVRGDVVIEDDGSGEIEIAMVGGSVLIENDGSGSIDVREVAANLEIRRDGSGGVHVSGIRGRVSIPKSR